MLCLILLGLVRALKNAKIGSITAVSDRVLFHGQKTKEDVKTFYHNADAIL